MCISLSFSHLNKFSLILHPSMMDMLPNSMLQTLHQALLDSQELDAENAALRQQLTQCKEERQMLVENQKEIKFYEEERKRTKKEMEINLRSRKQTLHHQQTILIICILPQMNIFIQQMFCTSSKLNYKPRSSSTYERVWPFWFDTEFYCQILAGINPEQEHPESTPRSQI